MTDEMVLAEVFETHRPRLRAVAQRMLGSGGEADDAVQETWLRLARTVARGAGRGDAEVIDNLGGWLTTVVSRICLDHLRQRSSRRETPDSERPDVADVAPGPADAAELADSLGAALTVVLDTLSPNERLAFVLHDMFGVPFDEIAAMLDTSDAAARQYASRARRRVRGTAPDSVPSDGPARRDVVAAFLAAARDGEFDALLRLLAPDATLHADAAIVAMGGVPELRGRHDVAGMFSGRARAARMALVDGHPGAAWWQGGELRVVFAFHVAGDHVSGIEQIADPERLARMVVEPL